MKSIWTYSELLPEIQDRYKVTLGEGGTPLIRSNRIGPMIGLHHLYFKLEIVNPTGSYKDRFAASAVSHLKRDGASFCMATSSGNTGSALAAYCAAAGMPCFLLIVDGAPSGKLQQMRVYGANIILIRGFGKSYRVTEEVFSILGAFGNEYGSPVQISAYHYSPLGMAGVQTIAYEMAEELVGQIDHVFSPAGGGGLILSVVKGFQRWREAHGTFEIPKVHCIQPMGNNTISGPLREGLFAARSLEASTTSISGLQVPNVIDGDEAIKACRATGGRGFVVTDELVYACQGDLCRLEGIYCEPAGAVSLAGVKMALKERMINADDHVVCLITGHGFKDPLSSKSIAATSPELYFERVQDAFQYLKSSM